jgi:hypothetical protein
VEVLASPGAARMGGPAVSRERVVRISGEVPETHVPGFPAVGESLVR